jgi:hypothetical protein
MNSPTGKEYEKIICSKIRSCLTHIFYMIEKFAVLAYSSFLWILPMEWSHDTTTLLILIHISCMKPLRRISEFYIYLSGKDLNIDILEKQNCALFLSNVTFTLYEVQIELYRYCLPMVSILRSTLTLRKIFSLIITFNPLNAELNLICHFFALLRAHHIFHVGRIRVKFHFQRIRRQVTDLSVLNLSTGFLLVALH